MKTTSGARVFKVGGRAIKVGHGDVGKRVQTQASYCRRLGPAVCPRIDLVIPHGYVMESLQPYDRTLSPESYVHDVTDALEQHVWSNPSDTPVNWGTHLDYILGRATKYVTEQDFFDVLMAWETLGLKTRALKRCLTHGDPTFDNMMMRGEETVVIDPLPPYENGEMPELMAVDVGKIMQSLFGYEEIKYGTSPWLMGGPLEYRLSLLRKWLPVDEHEWRAAHWFLIAHIIRLIPYQPEDKRPACIDMLRLAVTRANDL